MSFVVCPFQNKDLLEIFPFLSNNCRKTGNMRTRAEIVNPCIGFLYSPYPGPSVDPRKNRTSDIKPFEKPDPIYQTSIRKSRPDSFFFWDKQFYYWGYSLFYHSEWKYFRLKYYLIWSLFLSCLRVVFPWLLSDYAAPTRKFSF